MPLYATRPTGFQHNGLHTVTESRPAAPPPHPEVPTGPYTMPPVDAVVSVPAPAVPPPVPARWRRIAGPVALAAIAALILALFTIILMGRPPA